MTVEEFVMKALKIALLIVHILFDIFVIVYILSSWKKEKELN